MEIDDLKNKVQSRLIAVSMVIAFYYYANAKIDGVSLIGAKVEFRNQSAIIEFLWIFWIYYFVRSYQYFKDQGQTAYRAALDALLVEEFGPRVLRMDVDDFRLLPHQDAIKSSTIRPRVVFCPRGYMSEFEVKRGWSPIGWIFRFLVYPKALWRRIVARTQFRQHKRINLLVRRDAPPAYLDILHRTTEIIRILWPRFLSVQTSPLALVLSGTLSLGVQLTIYPSTTSHEVQGRTKQYVYFGARALPLLVVVFLRSIFLRSGFVESYGPLLIGLVPVWYVVLARHGSFW